MGSYEIRETKKILDNAKPKPAPYGRCACGAPMRFWNVEFGLTDCDKCAMKQQAKEMGHE